MGRGNVCVFGKYEGLYYVDRDYIDYYIPIDGETDEGKFLEEMKHNDFDNFVYDEYISMANYEDFISVFKSMMENKFKSFISTDKDYGIILENELFEIEIEDNQWSYAVKLIQKENYYYSLEGLQAKHYKNYLEGIKRILLEMYPSIGCYGGAWTHGIIKREDVA